MKFIDFFAGIGGFRRGMELAGHECVGFCEFDKFAVASYTSMHLVTDEQRKYLETLTLKKRQKEILKEKYRNGEWYANDIRAINAADIPRADCWCFGFPCQDISVAGKQRGFKGNRSSLFFAVTRLLRAIKEENRPQYLFIENVKNLLSVNRGYDFARLLTELDEIGYDAEWQVLNSENFGVPQHRERVFIIGHLRGRSGTEVFPVEGTNRENRVSLIGHRSGYRRNMQTYFPDEVTEALDTCQGGNREFHVAQPICFCDLNYGETKYTESARCLQARYHKGISNMFGANSGVCVPVLTPERAKKRQNGRQMKENRDPMFTLASQDRHGVALGVLRLVRTDFGKQIHKDYESGNIKISRHKFLAYEIRGDGNSNTLSTVAKDNYLAIGTREVINIKDVCMDLKSFSSKTRGQPYRIGHAPTLDHNCNIGIFVKISNEYSVYAIWSWKYKCYIAIRRLTPKECFRLQGWKDEYFERAQFVNSDSQLYKQGGNGVTVPVIQAIAERMGDGA